MTDDLSTGLLAAIETAGYAAVEHRHEPWAEPVLRLCQAHREIVAMYQKATNSRSFSVMPDLDHASAMGRLTALGNVLKALAQGYDLAASDPHAEPGATPLTEQLPPNPLAEVFADIGRNLHAALAKTVLQLAAQGVLGDLLRGDPDQARGRLDRLASEHLELISTAARELTAVADGILEDRAC